MNSQSIFPGVESQRRAAELFPDASQKPESDVDTFVSIYTLRRRRCPAHRQAELFYLQKQIQSQTPMVIVLEDGEKLEGQIEWYDRGVLKVRGRAKILIYKSAIKYMYKLGEVGQ